MTEIGLPAGKKCLLKELDLLPKHEPQLLVRVHMQQMQADPTVEGQRTGAPILR